MIKSNRRKFIAAAAALTATSALSANSMVKEDKLIAHQVYFWLKNPASAEDRLKLIEGINTLKKIESVIKISVGLVAATEKRPVIDDTWSVSELVYFKDLEGQKVYQVHQIHQDFAKNYSHLWSKVLVYDSQLI